MLMGVFTAPDQSAELWRAAIMTRPGFCSTCGRQIKIKRGSFLPVYCAGCKPRWRLAPVALLSMLGLIALLSFSVGRWTAPAKILNFIGRPVESATLLLPPDANRATADSIPKPSATSPAEDLITDCSAPTKAGHPCRRKVHGWAYCWQHRDKLGKKPLPRDPALLEKIQQPQTNTR